MTRTIQEPTRGFLTPEGFARQQAQRMVSPRGGLILASCRGGAPLAERIYRRYQTLLAEAGSEDSLLYLDKIDRRFSDGEAVIRLEEHVGGADVFLVQSLFDPTSGRAIDEEYMSFLIAVRAFKEHGARQVTAVLPYLAYARQDKPTQFMREPTTARLMADLATTSGVDQLVVWDAHCDQLRGFYNIPVKMLDPMSVFAEEFAALRGRDDVIVVAPDVGASKFVTHFGWQMGLKCAVAAKTRPAPGKVVITDVIGDFTGKTTALVLDDMIGSAGTMHEVVRKLVTEKGIREVYLGASHNVGAGKARQRLEDLRENYNLRDVVVTNSIPLTEEFRALEFIRVRCLSDPLARTINRLHYNRSVSEVFRPTDPLDGVYIGTTS